MKRIGDTVIFYDEDDIEYEFIVVSDEIRYEGNSYIVLDPAGMLEGFGPDDYLVAKVIKHFMREDNYEIVRTKSDLYNQIIYEFDMQNLGIDV